MSGYRWMDKQGTVSPSELIAGRHSRWRECRLGVLVEDTLPRDPSFLLVLAENVLRGHRVRRLNSEPKES